MRQGLVTSFVVAFLVAGCGPGEEPLFDVAGTVTFDGKPVPIGTIYFEPDGSLGNDGPQGTAHIQDGKFDTAAGGTGVRGGAYIIRVQGYDGKPRPELPYGKDLFPEYEEKKDFPKEKSTLRIEITK